MIVTVTFFPLFFFTFFPAEYIVLCTDEMERDSTERINREIFNSQNGLLHQR